MTACTVPPAGWTCSRELGHEGPCAARSDAPYNDYVDKVIKNSAISFVVEKVLDGQVVSETNIIEIEERELSDLLAEAWLNGLAYSLELMPKETK